MGNKQRSTHDVDLKTGRNDRDLNRLRYLSPGMGVNDMAHDQQCHSLEYKIIH